MISTARWLALTAAVVLGWASGPSEAAMISFSAGPAISPFDTSGNTTLTGQFSQFNPSLGTLTGVSFAGIVDANSLSITLANSGNTAIAANSYAVNGYASGFATAPGVPQASFTSLPISTSQAIPAHGMVTFTGSTSTPFTISPTSLGGYSGTGTVSLQFLLHLTVSTLPNNVTATFNSGTIADLRNATVTYQYTPAVPEPSSLILCGIGGMVGLGMAAKRRKRAD